MQLLLHFSGRPQFPQEHADVLFQRIDGRAREERGIPEIRTTVDLHRRVDRSAGNFRR